MGCLCNHSYFDCGHTVHDKCFCHEDQGSGYTFQDEYGDCDFCEGKFIEGQIVGANKYNESVVCTCKRGEKEIEERSKDI